MHVDAITVLAQRFVDGDLCAEEYLGEVERERAVSMAVAGAGSAAATR